MTRHTLTAAFLLALALPAFAQAPCTLAQAGVKTRLAGAVSDWWPKTTAQPTGGSVQAGSGPQVPLSVVKPGKAHITAGVAPDALAFCFPLAKLARGDALAISLTIGGVSSKVADCRFETGDAYSFRNYGTPPRKLATIEPRIVPAGATTGVCSVDAAAPPPVLPPVVEVPEPPAQKAWVDVSTENQPIGAAPGVLVRFGLGTTWTPEKAATAGALCDLEFFGDDPAPGRGKFCQALQ